MRVCNTILSSGYMLLACSLPAQVAPGPEYNALKAAFDQKVKVEVQQPHDVGVAELNVKYTGALDRALETAQRGGKLEDALAVTAEKNAVATGNGVPATDDPMTPPLLKQLRDTYRTSLARLDAERMRRVQPLQAVFATSLDALIANLTKQGKLQEAVAVKTERATLVATTSGPPTAMLGTPSTANKPLSGYTKESPFINSLGMKFVPVPGTTILMCIHETRKGDYAAHAAANSKANGSWQNAVEMGVPVSTADDHPVVEMNFEDAAGFCTWLSSKEGRKYRLPTDREWSHAVGIGSRESKDETAALLNGKIPDEYPWGRQWPPSKSDGNFADESYKEKFGKGESIEKVKDGFATTAPVMSFKPNKLGLYDLGGNVWEWCQDWLIEGKGQHVNRGGSWINATPSTLLSSYRAGGSVPSPQRGFRCVLDMP